MTHPQDGPAYDLFKCPCSTKFRRSQLVGQYPKLACPYCQRTADTAWVIEEEPAQRKLRVAKAVVNERSKALQRAKADYQAACKMYEAAFEQVTGKKPTNNFLRDAEPTIVEGHE